MNQESEVTTIAGCKSGEERLTNIYHLAYAPEVAKAYVFCWGCNLKCQGCLCKKEINCLALEGNLDVCYRDQMLPIQDEPSRFLTVSGAMDILRKVPVKAVLFEGQEASIDPTMPQMCQKLHQEFGCYITLNTNGVKLPDLSHVDEVVMSIKAITPQLHQDYTKRSNQSILKNFAKAYNSGVTLRAETVLIPDYIDLEEMEKVALFVAGVDPNIPLRIDAYFESGGNPWRKPTDAEVKEAMTVARRHLKNVSCTQAIENMTSEDLMFEVKQLF